MSGCEAHRRHVRAHAYLNVVYCHGDVLYYTIIIHIYMHKLGISILKNENTRGVDGGCLICVSNYLYADRICTLTVYHVDCVYANVCRTNVVNQHTRGDDGGGIPNQHHTSIHEGMMGGGIPKQHTRGDGWGVPNDVVNK